MPHKLKTLTGLLRKETEKLTQDTQAYLTTLEVQETQGTAMSLHSAVSKLEKAQKLSTKLKGPDSSYTANGAIL